MRQGDSPSTPDEDNGPPAAQTRRTSCWRYGGWSRQRQARATKAMMAGQQWCLPHPEPAHRTHRPRTYVR